LSSFPDKLLRECEAALAIGGTSSGIEKEGAARKKFPARVMRTFSRNLSGTDFARRLPVLSKYVARLRDDGDGMQRQIVSTILMENPKTYANRTGGTSL
jgi:hypothetical protein